MKPPHLELTPELSSLGEEDLLQVLEAVAQRGTMVSFFYGGRRRVLINDPAATHRLLVEGTDAMRSTPITDTVRQVIGDGLVTATMPQWRPRRMLVQRQLSRSKVAEQAETIAANVQDRITHWLQLGAFDLQEQMAALTLDNLGDTVFGGKFQDYRDLVRRSMRQMQTVVEAANAGRQDRESYAQLAVTVAALDEMVHTLLQRPSSADSGEQHLIDVLYQAVRTGEPAFADPWLRDEAVTLITAGHDTTAFLTTMATYLLARHPDVLQQLRNQAVRALAAPSSAAALLETVPLAREVVEETLRLYRPIAAMHRTATEPMQIGGFDVDRGTILVLSPWITHRDPRFFHQPNAFDPARFSSSDEQRSPRTRSSPSAAEPGSAPEIISPCYRQSSSSSTSLLISISTWSVMTTRSSRMRSPCDARRASRCGSVSGRKRRCRPDHGLDPGSGQGPDRTHGEKMKVAVNRALCENHGQCAFIAPEVFHMDADGILEYDESPDDSTRDLVEEAVDICPVQAISVRDV